MPSKQNHHPAKDKTQEELREEIATLKRVAIASAEAVYHYRLISRSISRSEDTLADWRKDDPEFSRELEEARFRFLNKQVKRAKPEFLLERLEPDVFKQRTETKFDGDGVTQLVVIRAQDQPSQTDNKDATVSPNGE